MCELAKDAGQRDRRRDDRVLGRRRAGAQGPRRGLPGAASRPARRLKVGASVTTTTTSTPRASQVNDALTANPNLVGIFAANNTSGERRRPRDQGQQRGRPHPGRRLRHRPAGERGARRRLDRRARGPEPVLLRLPGRHGGRHGRGRHVPPRELDPGAVVADKENMDAARGQAAAEPADRRRRSWPWARATTDGRRTPRPSRRGHRRAAGRLEGLRARSRRSSRRRPRAARRRGALPRRRERRRQEHADQDPDRRAPARQRRVRDRRQRRRRPDARLRRATPASASSTRSSACCPTCRSRRTC